MVGRLELHLVPQVRLDDFAVELDADRCALAALVPWRLRHQPVFQGHAAIGLEGRDRRRVGDLVGVKFDHL
ncbi:hypothetical protein D3C71_2234040 [compost metagenome]